MRKVFVFISLWLPVTIWCMIIFYLSSVPNLNSGLGTWDVILRKIAHITEYGILTILLWRAFKFHNVQKIYNWSGFLAVLYAISDEVHQGFIPTRNASVYDVLIDTVGVFIAVWLIHRISSSRAMLMS